MRWKEGSDTLEEHDAKLSIIPLLLSGTLMYRYSAEERLWRKGEESQRKVNHLHLGVPPKPHNP